MVKNPWVFSDRDAWAANMQMFAAESGGVVRLVVIRKCDMPDVIDAARAGEPFAVGMVQVIGHAVHALKKKPPMLCLTCDRSATSKRIEAFAVMVPTTGTDFASAIAAPICRVCFAKPQLRNNMMAVFQKGFGFEQIADESEV